MIRRLVGDWKKHLDISMGKCCD